MSKFPTLSAGLFVKVITSIVVANLSFIFINSKHESFRLVQSGLDSYLKHDLRDAEEKWVKALNCCEDKEYAKIAIYLGCLMSEESRFDEAEKYQKIALEKSIKYLGLRNPESAFCMMRLGVTLRNRNDFLQAERLLKDALKILVEKNGEINPDVANCMTELATLYLKTNQHTESECLYRKAYEVNKSIFGDDSLTAAVSASNLGFFLLKERRNSEAEIFLDLALKANQNAYGAKSSEVKWLKDQISLISKNSKTYNSRVEI